MNSDTKVIVIGGGVAGYTAALEASRQGCKVTLAEKEVMGGICLHTGCFPTKTMLYYLHLHKRMQKAYEEGIYDVLPEISYRGIQHFTEKTIAELEYGMRWQLKKAGVEVIYAEAVITDVDKKEVTFTNQTGEQKKIKADAIICATGADWNLPRGYAEFDGKSMSFGEFFQLEKIPDELAVIGGGTIGMEVAQIAAAFGSKVTIYEKADRILSFMEEELSDFVLQNLKEQGVNVKINSNLIDVVEKTAVYCCGKRTDAAEEKAGIYHIGDCSPAGKHATEAIWQAKHIVTSILQENVIQSENIWMSFVYTIPPIAQIGMTETEAQGKGIPVYSKESYCAVNGRAKLQGIEEGFVKTVIHRDTGEILGFSIAGEGADELLGEACTILHGKLSEEILRSLPHPHPCLCEIFTA